MEIKDHSIYIDDYFLERGRPWIVTGRVYADDIQLFVPNGCGIGYVKRAFLAWWRLKKNKQINWLTTHKYSKRWRANILIRWLPEEAEKMEKFDNYNLDKGYVVKPDGPGVKKFGRIKEGLTSPFILLSS